MTAWLHVGDSGASAEGRSKLPAAFPQVNEPVAPRSCAMTISMVGILEILLHFDASSAFR